MLVLEEEEQRRHRLEIADRAEGLRRRAPQVAIGIAEHVHQRAHGLHRPDGPQRLHRREAQLLAGLGEEGQEARDGLRVAHLAEGAQGGEADPRVGLVQQGKQVRRRLRLLQLPEGEHTLLADQAAGIAQGAPEDIEHARRLQLPERGEGRGADGLAGIPGRADERGGGPGISEQSQGLGRAHARVGVGAGQGLQQQRHHALSGQAREPVHGALLDQLALVAEQLEEEHGRVLVAQPADGGRGFRPHLGRRVVDQGGDEVGGPRGGDPGQAARDPLAHGVGGMGEARGVGLAVLEPDRHQGVGRILLDL